MKRRTIILVLAAYNMACDGDTIRIFGGNYAELFANAGAIQKILFMDRGEKPQTPSGNVIIGP